MNLSNIIKNGALLFTIGVAVALLAPVIVHALAVTGFVNATVLGVAGHSVAEALWTGIVFGTFGALHAGLAPLWDKWFGKMETPDGAAKDAACDARSPNLQLAGDIDIARAAQFTKQIEEARRQAQTLARN